MKVIAAGLCCILSLTAVSLSSFADQAVTEEDTLAVEEVAAVESAIDTEVDSVPQDMQKAGISVEGSVIEERRDPVNTHDDEDFCCDVCDSEEQEMRFEQLLNNVNDRLSGTADCEEALLGNNEGNQEALLGATGKASAVAFHISFPDMDFEEGDTPELFRKILVGGQDPSDPAYPYESLNAFYQRASYGKLAFTGEVYPYTALHERSWYIQNGGAEALALEAISAMDGVIDYSRYDTNGNPDGGPDGFVDAFYIHYPGGAPEGWSTPMWSRLLTINEKASRDGVRFYNGACLHYDNTTDNYNRVIIHETGHMMGLPDLYYYPVNGKTPDWRTGTLTWDMMEMNLGDQNAYFKWLMGWIDYSQITRVVANKEGVKVYHGNEPATVQPGEGEAFAEIVQNAFDQEDYEKTGGFTIISSKDAASEKEAIFSDFFIAALEQPGGNQTVYFGEDKSIVPAGFRIYKIQGKTMEDDPFGYIHKNTDGEKHNLLIECMDYDYSEPHVRTGQTIPSCVDGNYNCYLPVGETFDYQTYPSTNFRESRSLGFTGIIITVKEVNAGEGKGILEVGYSPEGKFVDPDDFSLVPVKDTGLVNRSFLRFAASSDFERGSIYKAKVFIGDEEHSVYFETDPGFVDLFFTDVNIDGLTRGTAVKVVFEEKTFILGYDDDGSPILSKEIVIPMDVGPQVSVAEKSIEDALQLDRAYLMSSSITDTDKVYQLYSDDDVRQLQLAFFDRRDPTKGGVKQVNGLDIPLFSIGGFRMLSVSDRVLLTMIWDSSMKAAFYWIDTESGKIIAKKNAPDIFDPEESVGSYAASGNGRLYRLTFNPKDGQRHIIATIVNNNGELSETDLALEYGQDGRMLQTIFTGTDPGDGRDRVFLNMFKVPGPGESGSYEVLVINEEYFYEELVKRQGDVLTAEDLYKLDGIHYPVNNSQMQLQAEAAGMNGSLIRLLQKSEYQDGKWLYAYILQSVDPEGNVIGELTVDSASGIPDMRFSRMQLSDKGNIAIIGSPGSNRPEILDDGNHEIILLKQEDLSQKTSTLTSGLYCCTGSNPVGYWKDGDYYTVLNYALSRYDSEANKDRLRAYIVKVGDAGPGPEPVPEEKQPLHRVYNPNSGEHFYTASTGEKNALVRLGWEYEGIGWTAPVTSASPVYRLYNPNAGDHHYTLSKGEKNWLVRLGWKYERIGWYSDDAMGVPVYRQYNPNARAGAHNFSASKGENDWLVKLGWRAEGIGWYGVKG